MIQKIPPSIIAVILLVIVATGIIVLTLVDSNKNQQPIRSGIGITTNLPITVTTRIPATDTSREGLSRSDSTSAGFSRAERYSGNAVNQCSLVQFKDPDRPLADGFTWENATVFNFGTAGNYSSPFGKEETRIPVEQAKEIIKTAFPNYSPDRIDMEFDEGYSYRRWEFDLHKDDKQLVRGGLDSRTGELMSYFIPSFYGGDTQEKPDPAITIESARLVAENEIQERNGELPLKLMDSQVNPYSNYVFNYRRIIHGVPSLNNGIWVGIDARTGKVGSYSKSWEVPEDAVAASSVTAISREQATALVEREAKACYPESAYSFRIVSADLQWMDSYPADKFIPKPGVIPLAWHIRFNDKTIRAEDIRRTNDAWVDAQNGTLLSMEYFHTR